MGAEPPSLESTATLLVRVRRGEAGAEDALVARFLPLLQRWARGRLPGQARGLAETDDLVQVSLLRALRRLDQFESRREGAFLAYLRKIVLNAIREECRRSAAREGREDKFAAAAVNGSTNAPDAADDKTLAAYEAALEKLPERQREAVILRLEFQYSYSEIASAIEGSSEDAARMLVKRTLVRLAKEMQRGGGSMGRPDDAAL